MTDVIKKTSLVSLLSLAAAATLLIAGAAPAASDGFGSGGPWQAPTRDGGHGDWFARACAFPLQAAASCGAQIVTDAAGRPLQSPNPPPNALGPAQFHGAYSLPLTAPTAQTVAIVDAYNDPNIVSDLAAYDAQYGLPGMASGPPNDCSSSLPCFEQVNETGGGGLPAANSGWALEISLDVETVHEICQNCNIILVEASSASMTDLGKAENEAASLGANVISNSWGAGEYPGETSDSSSYFEHPGVAITASAGDSGYGVEFPAASQYVTAVGGTTLSVASTASGGTSTYSYGGEKAWADTGSGCSQYIPKPRWQGDSGCSNRTVADVAADADPNTGAAVYDSDGYSGWLQVGGTSLSAQLIAGVYALTGDASAVYYGQAPYNDPGGLNDVTSGSNGSCGTYLCNAVAGYDGPTGLGSPNGLGAFWPPLSVTPESQTVSAASGGTANYTVTLRPVDGFSGQVNLEPLSSSNSTLPAGVSEGLGSSSTVAAGGGGAPRRSRSTSRRAWQPRVPIRSPSPRRTGRPRAARRSSSSSRVPLPRRASPSAPRPRRGRSGRRARPATP